MCRSGLNWSKNTIVCLIKAFHPWYLTCLAFDNQDLIFRKYFIMFWASSKPAQHSTNNALRFSRYSQVGSCIWINSLVLCTLFVLSRCLSFSFNNISCPTSQNFVRILTNLLMIAQINGVQKLMNIPKNGFDQSKPGGLWLLSPCMVFIHLLWSKSSSLAQVNGREKTMLG